jgi:hypothetical protein
MRHRLCAIWHHPGHFFEGGRMQRRDFLAVGAAGLAAACWPSRFAVAAKSDGQSERHIWASVFERLPMSLRGLIDDPEYQIQLLWWPITRDRRGRPRVERHSYGLAPKRWFSPASVTKLPMALLMAERISALGLDADAQIRLNAAPETGEWPAEEPLTDRFRRGCNRTFTISENVPYNRWYEYMGADAINKRLAQLGYRDTRLIARLGSPDPEANRRSRGGAIIAADGRVVESTSAMTAAERRFPFGTAKAGRGWQNSDGTVTPGPRDFSHVNFMPLTDSLNMLQSFVLPETVSAKQRWRIAEPLRGQLLQALALRPRESEDPRYPESEFYDGYARWFLVGDGKQRYPDNVRVLGKTGMAYGYLSEVAYIQDGVSGAECFLAASIHTNRDGIYNDDRYEYDTIGFPFLATFGRAMLDVERERAKSEVMQSGKSSR